MQTSAHIHEKQHATLQQYATSTSQYAACLARACAWVRSELGFNGDDTTANANSDAKSNPIRAPECAIVLGSGLMDFVNNFDQNHHCKSVAYSDVPFMPGTNVPGHSGRLYFGCLPSANGPPIPVLCFAGRVHAYEGWSSAEFNFIVRLAHGLGVRTLVLTNSAGGALEGMDEGDIMLIDDHIRMSGTNPLKDVMDDARFGPKHCVSARAYSASLRDLVRGCAARLNMRVLSGTYCWTSGPSYETPSEVQAGRILSVGGRGGAFGMSTVPEVLAAYSLGMEVVAISLCTNLAAGLGDKELTHGDVKNVAEVAGPRFQKLLLDLFAHIQTGKEEKKHAADVEDARRDLHSLSSAPSHTLFPVVGWTPSTDDVRQTARRIDLLNSGRDEKERKLAAAILCFGGAQQSELQKSLIAGLHDVHTMPLRELCDVWAHHPSLMSSYARTALAMVGTTSPASTASSKRIFVLLSPDGSGICGLSAAESSLLMQALCASGASTIIASIVAADTREVDNGAKDETKPAGADASKSTSSSSSSSTTSPILLIEDVLDRSVDPLPLTALCADPDSAGPPHANPTDAPLFDPLLSRSLQQSLVSAASSSSSTPVSPSRNMHVGSYIGYQGPMLPTRAELSMCHHAGGMSAAGISNISWVEVARQLGMQTAIVVRSVARLEWITAEEGEADKQNHKVQLDHANLIAQAVLHLLRNDARVVPAVLSRCADKALAASVAACSYLPWRGYGPVRLDLRQEDWPAVQAGAAWLAERCGEHRPKTLLFVEGMLRGALPVGLELMSEGAWDASAMPGLPQSLGLDATGTSGVLSGSATPYDPRVLLSGWQIALLRVRATGSTLLALINQHDRTGEVPAFHGLNFIVRCCKLLDKVGCTNLLLLAPVASCSSEVTPGSLVAMKDHINLTGVNPLFGDNCAHFGPRFNDMSVVYRAAGIACFTSQPGTGEKMQSSVCMQTINPAMASVSEATLARAIGASTLVSGLTPQATLAKHMDMMVTAVGYVYRRAGTADDATLAKHGVSESAAIHHHVVPPSADTLATLRTLIINAVDRLHDAGVAHNATLKTGAVTI